MAEEKKEEGIILTFTNKEIEGLEDYDIGEKVEMEMVFEVTGKKIIEKEPEVNEEGERIIDVASEPVYKLNLELIESNITNKKPERKEAEEMGLDVKEVRKIKEKSAKRRMGIVEPD